MTRPTVGELLEELRHDVGRAEPVVRLVAAQLPSDPFPDAVPGTLEGDAASRALRELAPDPDGWIVDAKRAWSLESGPGLTITVGRGTTLEEALAQLDRLRAELEEHPELLNEDWERPFQRKPTLRMVR